MPTYPFTEEQALKANEEWGCNCGPTALAFALQCSLEKARYLLPGFDQKRYTNPSMMRNAVQEAGLKISNVTPPRFDHKKTLSYDRVFSSTMALVRVQWSGPWTEPGVNPKWCYRFTHWIATWQERGVDLIFDCNGGIRGPESWETEIAPAIARTIPEADGHWYWTHIWRLTK